MREHVQLFRCAINGAGLNPPDEIEADGKLHRFASNGKRGDDAGWYVFHGDGVPAGAFGDWRSGLSETWRANIGRALSPQEEASHRARVQAIKREREAEEVRSKADASQKAEAIWQSARPAPIEHPYLVRKRVAPHGVRIHDGALTMSGMDCNGALVIPLRDETGRLHSLEFVNADGEKRYLAGGRTKGCYFGIGRPADVLVIAEGFATAASIHQATGYAIACAFSAGNLEPVTHAMRGKFPDIRVILAADNDANSASNIGVSKAQAAARAAGALVAVPEVDGGKCDFNDLHLARGDEAVRAAIASAQPPPMEGTLDGVPVLTLRRASEIGMEPVSWIWSGWLAAGKLHVLAGAPGTGKTTIALSLAATIASGGRFPDGVPLLSRGNVLMWSGEDDPADTLVPRLAAMHADLDRVHFVCDCAESNGRRPFDPARDMPALIAKARDVGDVRLLIVDPIVNTVPGDSHRNAEVRRGLVPLVTFGQELRAAVLGVSHFSKGTSGRDPLERLTGSLAFGALPRLVFGAARRADEHGKESRIFVRIKSNIGRDGDGFAYALATTELPQGIQVSRIAWGTKVEGSARDILDEAEQTDAAGLRSERADAAEFLRRVLADGPLKATEIYRQAREAGHAKRTLRRAAKDLGIHPSKEGMSSGWVWTLPKMATTPEDALSKTEDTFGNAGHLRDREAF
jgi:putative DNA primase/helicase